MLRRCRLDRLQLDLGGELLQLDLGGEFENVQNTDSFTSYFWNSNSYLCHMYCFVSYRIVSYRIVLYHII
ncbi:MAG: hypothetical protein ACI8RD_014248 [Bacillariaceae sp.]|jgi:hypothetical protein